MIDWDQVLQVWTLQNIVAICINQKKTGENNHWVKHHMVNYVVGQHYCQWICGYSCPSYLYLVTRYFRHVTFDVHSPRPNIPFWKGLSLCSRWYVHSDSHLCWNGYASHYFSLYFLKTLYMCKLWTIYQMCDWWLIGLCNNICFILSLWMPVLHW